jgi:hypothetical protein
MAEIIKQGDRVVCTCGFRHLGTVVKVLRYPLLAVAWDDAKREYQAMDPTFRDHHAVVGHMINVLARQVEIT